MREIEPCKRMRELKPCSKKKEIKHDSVNPCNGMREIEPCRSLRELKPCSKKKEIKHEPDTPDSPEESYRSKSAYDLLRMNSDLKFLKSANSVLDLCAAPGGWMQVALNKIPKGGFVLGVDVLPIRAIPGAISVVEDITTAKCKATIHKHMRIHGVRTFDVVLHDGSPIGCKDRDKAEEIMTSLIMESIKIATEFLSSGGTLVTKFFQTRESNAVIYCLGHLFKEVEVQIPSTSSGTTEMYIVGKFFKASLEIHPRLFDVKYIFDVEHQKRSGNYMFGTSKRILPHLPAIRRNVSASTFVWSESPHDIFDRAASFSFDSPCLEDHSLTTDKVKAFCKDLLVLGKQDLEHLLEWRLHMRKSLSSYSQKASVAEIEGDAELISEGQAKDKSHKSSEMQIDALEDGYADHALSSLSSDKGKTGFSAQKERKRNRPMYYL